MRRVALTVLASACVTTVARAETAVWKSGGSGDPGERHIDLAICLDTSGSMSGLINSVRMKLWQIVSELATAKPTPRLRVALLTYGTPSYGKRSGYVRIDLDLTDDLDKVYEKLMALRTDGGNEYVARVTKRAVTSLSWNVESDAYRVIFVAGNESADQDPKLKNEDVCMVAITRDIVVNTIYCGSKGNRDAEGYRRVAQLAEGRFSSIDQSGGTVTVATPFDDELARLGTELNKTYVAYGHRGKAGAANQDAQDANAAGMGGSVAAQRAVAKASSVYRNHSWDLVDARKDKSFKLDDVPETALPEEMRKMTSEEREAHLDKMAEQRKGIQEKVAALSARRRAHVKAEMKKRDISGKDSFDLAVRLAVREQAEKKGFEFKE